LRIHQRREIAMRAFRFAVFVCLLLPFPFVIGTALAMPKAYVGNFKDNTVSVIDTANGAVMATIPVAAGPHGMVLAPDGHEVFVSGDASSNVSVIDASKDQVVGAIEVGKSPHGLAMASDGRVLMVAVYGEDRVAFVDPARRAVVGTVAVRKPHTIALRPDGSVAYVASQEPGSFGLIVVDVATRSIVRIVTLDKPPRDPEWSFDGKALYFTLAGVDAVQVLDPATDKIVATIPTGASPHLASRFRGAAAGAALVQGPGEVLLFDPATHAPLRSIAVGKQPHWMAPAADGKELYVTNEGSNDVTIIDLASARTRTIAVGGAPRKVVVQRTARAGATAGAKVSIARFAFSPAVLTIARGQTVTWTNEDGAPHGLAYADGAPGVNPLLPATSFNRTYENAGTYDYACPVHPYMTGKVVVQGP